MTGSEHPSAAAESLAAVPFLAPLDPVDLAKLAGVLEDCWFDAGTVVFEAGGQGDALYILREGTAERRVADSRIGLIHPPEVFGELALLTDQPRSSSVVAVTPIRVWVLPKHRVHTLLRAEPELMLALSRAIGMELAHARRALGELLHELEQWVAGRLAALTPQQRDVVEAAALFETPPPRVLERIAEAHAPRVASRSELARLAPLLQERDGGYAMPAAIRDALVRRIDAEGRREAVAARVYDVARDLERAGHAADALAAFRAAGADSDVKRLIANSPALAQVEHAVHEEPIRPSREAITVKPRRKHKFDTIKLTGMALALVPLLFWTTVPPEGLTPAGWRALLTLLSAAFLFASEALPEAVTALGLIAVWVVGGVVPPRDALDGFATQSWVLVLAVLAVGVAVGNSGLLYRVALLALGRKPASFARRCVTLALVGTAVTPTLPNATSRAALAAPMVREVVEALGYGVGGRAATGLALASFVGFGQMAGLFLTGSSVGLLVHGLLPPSMRAEFNFAGWFVAALPLHFVLLAASLAAVFVLYRPEDTLSNVGDRLALQRAVLGRMRREEKLCVVVLLGLIAGFLTEPLHGIHGAWIGVAALAALAARRRARYDDAPNRRELAVPGVFRRHHEPRNRVPDAARRRVARLASFRTDRRARFERPPVLHCARAGGLRTLVRNPLAGRGATADAGRIAVGRCSACPSVSDRADLPRGHASLVSAVPEHGYLAFYMGPASCSRIVHARPLAWWWGPMVLISLVASWPVWRLMGLVG